ncbi:MAG: crp-like helix-turn-helix domain protein [Caulobacteraceae bacterium]|nr:crp-like helix-turn-helix domain protein [Caulobacteraceae bacterium]
MNDFLSERSVALVCEYLTAENGAAAHAGAASREGDASHAHNQFLSRLQPGDFAAIEPLLTRTTFKVGQTLHSAGVEIRDIHFLTEGLVGLIVPFADGNRATTALVGREGVVGLSPALVPQYAVESATVLVAGEGYRLPVQAIRQLFGCHSNGVAIARALARQVTELQVELACRTHHTVEQRLARLLLEACRKLGANRLVLTQEELALMLGVQRTTVSTLAAKLKERGALAYLRGAIRIASSERLAVAACGCGVDTLASSDASHRAPSAVVRDLKTWVAP